MISKLTTLSDAFYRPIIGPRHRRKTSNGSTRIQTYRAVPRIMTMAVRTSLVPSHYKATPGGRRAFHGIRQPRVPTAHAKRRTTGFSSLLFSGDGSLSRREKRSEVNPYRSRKNKTTSTQAHELSFAMLGHADAVLGLKQLGVGYWGIGEGAIVADWVFYCLLTIAYASSGNGASNSQMRTRLGNKDTPQKSNVPM